MARFTSIHPLQLTEPHVTFAPSEAGFVCETDDEHVAAALRALPAGFHVTEVVSDDLEDRTIPELEDYALEYGIDLSGLGSKPKKADIVEAIRAHFTEPDEPSGGEPETTPAVLVSPDAEAEGQPVDAVDDHGDTE